MCLLIRDSRCKSCYTALPLLAVAFLWVHQVLGSLQAPSDGLHEVSGDGLYPAEIPRTLGEFGAMKSSHSAGGCSLALGYASRMGTGNILLYHYQLTYYIVFRKDKLAQQVFEAGVSTNGLSSLSSLGWDERNN